MAAAKNWSRETSSNQQQQKSEKEVNQRDEVSGE